MMNLILALQLLLAAGRLRFVALECNRAKQYKNLLKLVPRIVLQRKLNEFLFKNLRPTFSVLGQLVTLPIENNGESNELIASQSSSQQQAHSTNLLCRDILLGIGKIVCLRARNEAMLKNVAFIRKLQIQPLSYICLLFFVLFSTVACGPERSGSDQGATVRVTEEIATSYQATRDLNEARLQLDELDVANVNQWLILTTEEAIKGSESRAASDALVTLTLDLGLQSNAIMAYARQNNLLPVQSASSSTIEGENGSANGGTNSDDSDALANNISNVIIPLPTSGENEIDTDNGASIEEQPPTATTTSEDVSSVAESAAPLLDDNVVGDNVVGDNVVDSTIEEEASVVLEPTAVVEPTATPNTQPLIRAASGINVRMGPGTNYPIAGAMAAGDSAQILSKNSTGDWWEVLLSSGSSGWVYGALVVATGDVAGIAVAVNIPTPPPTPIPAPTDPPAEPPAEVAPIQEPVAEPEPAPSGGPDFRVVEKRLWDVVENGGHLDGPSVTCGEKRQLVARVLDANGNLLNGVAVQAIYGAQEIFVTGTQGKGEGAVEFVLGGGQALKVIRDVDGREVSSDEVYNLSTKPWEIPFETLIGGNFCTDDASCQSFVDATGCYGHYSWTVTFQRGY